LEAAREELARVRASEQSYAKAVAEWKVLATDLRRQLDQAAEVKQRESEGWNAAFQDLRRRLSQREDEIGRLGHSLAQATAQGQGSERDQLLIAQLKRRVTREYLLSFGVAGC
jgi:chromosome segregation ATPase